MSNPRFFFRPNHTPRRFLGLLAILLITGGSALPSVAPVSARSAAHRPADAPMIADPQASGNPGAESRPSPEPASAAPSTEVRSSSRALVADPSSRPQSPQVAADPSQSPDPTTAPSG